MKTIFFAVVAGCIQALAITNGAYAQSFNNIASLEPVKEIIEMDNALNADKDNTAGVDVISTKAIKNFKRSYKMASDVKWYKVSNGIRARFTENSINNTVYYDKKGHWLASLKGYNEDKLARDVRSMVKREYFDYKITYVEEIETSNTNGKPTYIVHIEDDNNIKLIRVNDGSMDVYQEYTKDNTAK